jgi:tetratricopeptide (TPR) repeat protein
VISERKLDWVAGPLAHLARWRFPWGFMTPEQRALRDQLRSMDRLRYHLGRGRRAREAGRYEQGAAEARKALEANPQSPWSLALLGQCLARQRRPDLHGARWALERAQALEPMNGYFVGLLLDVLDAQGDTQGQADLLAWAWWQGAPVERWLPDGPPIRRTDRASGDRQPARAGGHEVAARAQPERRPSAWAGPRVTLLAAR